jgi:hypothetical protein
MRYLSLLALLLVCCADEQVALVITLVPNPEINTSADVAEQVNRLDVIFDAQGGFHGLDGEEGDTWGPYLVTDFDDDGDLELLLSRPGREALEPFAVTAGQQGDRLLEITARGHGTDGLLRALGGSTGGFREDRDTEVEIPFNLLPEYRPLRVLSLTPPLGARNLTSPVDDIGFQLGGEVLETSLVGQVTLRSDGVDVSPELILSYVDTNMGRLTNVRLRDCVLRGGPATVTVSTEVCTPTGQCLDQHLGVAGRQAFVGGFTIDGAAAEPFCDTAEVMSSGCPEIGCEAGYVCIDGACVADLLAHPESEELGECDAELCAPPAFVCDPAGICLPDCRIYGACVDPRHHCDDETGLCGE